MEAEINHLAVARKPQQARSRKRFEAILVESERLLEQDGLQGFSIPVIAERLGFNRRTIYALFPSPYAILNELTRRHINGLEQEMAQIQIAPDAGVEDVICSFVYVATNYHNRHPVGRLLILGGAVSDQSFRAQELTNHHLGNLGRLLLRSRGVVLPSGSPDVPVVAVELGTACMRISNSVHGRITREYAIESALVMLNYLQAKIPEFPGFDQARLEQIADRMLDD